jgi:zinc transport system ATP-binding protein
VLTGPDDRVLVVDRLSLEFARRPVFTDLSFEVPRGASLAIVGPNGAGKTVLFRSLIGALPARGTITWAPGVRIGYVPQQLDLARDVPITASDFLRAKIYRHRHAHRQIEAALAAVDLPPDVAGRSIGALSGGQFQRLLVAFALLGDPDVLMLDEPTAGVDEPGERLLNELVHRLQRERGLTVLLISHDLSVIFRYATAVLCLGHGRACFGVPRTVLTPDLLRQIYGTDVAFHVHEH